MVNLAEKLGYSKSNIDNVNSIIKRIAEGLNIPEGKSIKKSNLKNIDKLEEAIKDKISPKKYVEAIQIMYKLAVHKKVDDKHIDAINELRAKYKASKQTDYASNTKFIPEQFDEIKEKLKDNLTNDNTFNKRLAMFHYLFGGIRSGEIHKTKTITKGKTPPKDDTHNYLMIKTKKWVVNQFKNKGKKHEPRILDVPDLMINEAKKDKNETYFLSADDTTLGTTQLGRAFKKMTGVNMKDFRHMESEKSQSLPKEEREVIAKKNDHSVDTQTIVYSNKMTDELTDESILDTIQKIKTHIDATGNTELLDKIKTTLFNSA